MAQLTTHIRIQVLIYVASHVKCVIWQNDFRSEIGSGAGQASLTPRHKNSEKSAKTGLCPQNFRLRSAQVCFSDIGYNCFTLSEHQSSALPLRRTPSYPKLIGSGPISLSAR